MQRTLKDCAICGNEDEAVLHRMAEISTIRELEAGAWLFREGDACEGFFVLSSGRVRVSRAGPSGQETLVRICERGAILGHDAIFGERGFAENASAVGSVRVILVPRARFLGLAREFPRLSLNMMESLALKIRELSENFQAYSQQGARERTIRFLLTFVPASSFDADFELPEKKKEIASRLGITPETFSRVLRELEDSGLVSVQGKRILIGDSRKLQATLF